jgi:hypothetical protein
VCGRMQHVFALTSVSVREISVAAALGSATSGLQVSHCCLWTYRSGSYYSCTMSIMHESMITLAVLCGFLTKRIHAIHNGAPVLFDRLRVSFPKHSTDSVEARLRWAHFA